MIEATNFMLTVFSFNKYGNTSEKVIKVNESFDGKLKVTDSKQMEYKVKASHFRRHK